MYPIAVAGRTKLRSAHETTERKHAKKRISRMTPPHIKGLFNAYASMVREKPSLKEGIEAMTFIPLLSSVFATAWEITARVITNAVFMNPFPGQSRWKELCEAFQF